MSYGIDLFCKIKIGKIINKIITFSRQVKKLIFNISKVNKQLGTFKKVKSLPNFFLNF